MNKALFIIAVLTVTNAFSNTPVLTNAPTQPAEISVQEMLVSGPPQLKMHSLAMISQGSIKGSVDESYLPGLKSCTEDSSSPIRSIAARILGQHFVQDKEHPHPEAMQLLEKLARDESDDVRFSAIYYGLTQAPYKSPELVELLIDLAATQRAETLFDRIIVSLANYQPQVKEILDRKLKEGNAIAYFEIYEDFTGLPPLNADKYLDMPSSRPRLYVVTANDENIDAAKAALTKDLESAGIENPNIEISGSGGNNVLIITTYITRDRKTVEGLLSKNDAFQLTQSMWLTPQLEIQLQVMRKAK